MEKKKKIIIAIIIVIIVILLGALLYIIKLKPYLSAKSDYEAAAAIIEEKNANLDNTIKELQDVINSGDTPLETGLIDTANEDIKKAQQIKYVIGDMPSNTEKIKAKTDELKKPLDYTDTINTLKTDKTNLENSIKSYKQFDKPTEEFLISRLSSIDEIYDIEAVTEDHDPNGKLNKDGGYLVCIYFKDKNLDMSKYTYKDSNFSIDIGTDGGGCIEVYQTNEFSTNRANYLGAYDGGVLASGTHKVVNTTLIRTSNDLTATQEKNLEEKIINALAELKQN